MTDAYSKTCDDVRLNLYLDGELGDNEMAWMEAHLKDCPKCRDQASTIIFFTKEFRRRVKDAADAVDFKALEKKVLTQALPRYASRSPFSNFLASLKYVIPATLTAGVALFFVYTTYIAPPTPVPSAIINSFTGSVSSVMIFETPETRQTVLWYNEADDVESEQNAG